MITTDVLVVGGGPVGLAAAVECRRHGLQVVLVEQRPRDADKHPTANHLGVRVMELFRRWGVDGRIRLGTFDATHGDNRYWLTRVGGHVLHVIERPSNSATDSSPHSPTREVWAPKPYLDPLLEEVAIEHGAVLRHSHRLARLEQPGNRVVATVETPTGREQIEARWLIGADGASSTVRELTGLPLAFRVELPVTLHSTYFRSERLGHLLPRGGTQYAIGSLGGGMLVAIDGRARWRIHLPSLEDEPWTDARAAAVLREAFGDIDIEVLSVIPWRMRSSVTDAWRDRRIVLAGDSAHQVTPYGGLGMNYGVLDAEALGWRLGAIHAGWGGDRLLDDYVTERRSAVETLLAYQGIDFSTEPPTMTTKLAWPPIPDGLDDDGPEGDAVRRAFGEQLAAANVGHFDNVGVDLDQRLASPGIVPDGTPEPPWSVTSYQPVPRPGHRAPHIVLADDHSSLELFGDRFVLCLPNGTADPTGLAAACTARKVPILVADAPLDPDRAVLVRPDGVVAWRGPAEPHADPTAVVDRLRGVAD